ncbi:MAG TPA: DUF2188 domain-containing protein, partial [Candidatus Binatia bacterium]|nr:DUF2188 domain-containing protein [Candidatus Binatia bacterium]
VRYFVASNNHGGWFVFKEGLQRPVGTVARKINAIETAKVLARESAPSQVLVEKADGTFLERYAFTHHYGH